MINKIKIENNILQHHKNSNNNLVILIREPKNRSPGKTFGNIIITYFINLYFIEYKQLLIFIF